MLFEHVLDAGLTKWPRLGLVVSFSFLCKLPLSSVALMILRDVFVSRFRINLKESLKTRVQRYRSQWFDRVSDKNLRNKQ